MKKLSPGRIRVLALVNMTGTCAVGWQTNEAANTVHAPTAERLSESGHLTIHNGLLGSRYAKITDLGRMAVLTTVPPSDEKAASLVPDEKAVKSMLDAAIGAMDEEKSVPTPSIRYAESVPAGGWLWDSNEVVEGRDGAAFAVAKRHHVRRGRNAGRIEVTLAPLGEMRGNAYARVTRVRRGEPSSDWKAPRTRYTEEEVKRAVKKVFQTESAIRMAKEARANEGCRVLGDVDYKSAMRRPQEEYGCSNVRPGDIVTIVYRGGVKKDEEVVKVNVATGKVAIKAPAYKSGYRWIPAQYVRGIKTPERVLPFELTDERRAEVDSAGWKQFKFGREFIERSYVVAKSADGARKNGADYECSSSKVFYDPACGYYWRETGSFD